MKWKKTPETLLENTQEMLQHQCFDGLEADLGGGKGHQSQKVIQKIQTEWEDVLEITN